MNSSERLPTRQTAGLPFPINESHECSCHFLHRTALLTSPTGTACMCFLATYMLKTAAAVCRSPHATCSVGPFPCLVSLQVNLTAPPPSPSILSTLNDIWFAANSSRFCPFALAANVQMPGALTTQLRHAFLRLALPQALVKLYGSRTFSTQEQSGCSKHRSILT